MPFQSKEQFFYLLYNEPDVFMDWVEDYGVPKEFKVGSTEHWLRKIKQMEPKRKRKFAEEFSAYNPPQAAVNKIKQIINSITLEQLQQRYFDFLIEMKQEDNKEDEFNLSGGEDSFYSILLLNYLKTKGITEKSTKINCPSCLKKGYGKNKLKYNFFEELDEYSFEDLLETIKDYFRKSLKTVHWGYCYECDKDIRIPKEEIKKMYGEEVWNYLNKITYDKSILVENFDEQTKKQFKIYKKDIASAKKKMIKNIKIEDGKIKIYRALTANKVWLDKPNNKKSILNRGLGIFWTYDKKQAKTYFYEKPTAKYVRDYIIYALADIDEIDWKLSILLNSSDWKDENELRIIKGSPLDILAIDGQDRWYKPLDISMLPTKEIKATEEFSAYNPPQAAVNNAKRGLRLREKWNRGGMSPAEARKAGIDSGVTRAKKISSGSVSKHDVRRMSAFNRHRKNYAPSKKKPDGGPTAGTIAWLLWGGTSGVDWAKKKSAAMNAEDGAIAFGAESDESKLRKYEKTYGKMGAKVRLKLLKSIKGKNIYGTKAGQWSARKSQHLADEYEKAMTKKGAKPYKSSKRTKAQKSLKKWGDQKWKTKSGKKSSVTGERYLPSKAIDALTEKEYAKTTAAKRKAKKAGKQFSRQPPAIAKKVAAYRAEYKVGTQGPCWDGYKYVGPKPYSSGSCVKKAENIDIQGNSPKAKVDTLRGGVEAFTYDLTQLKEGDLMRDFLKGVINAFQTSIKGVNVAGMDKTLEEIAVKFLPNAEMRAELMAQEGYSENEHYHMGEVWGYDEVINFLSLYQVDFQRQFASEIEDKLQEDTELTKKEIKTIMWYPLVIGFMGGTLATVVGNVLSALYLKRKHGLWSSQE